MKLRMWLRRRADLEVRRARRALHLRSREGSVLVEFAVIVPVLMIALSGTVSVAMAFYSLQQVSNVCSSGVLAVAANQGFSNDDDPCALARTTVTGMLPNWTAGNFGYQISITDANGTVHYFPATQGALAYGSAFTCAGDSQYLSPNQPVALTVSFRYSWRPILWVNWSSLPPLSSTQGASVE